MLLKCRHCPKQWRVDERYSVLLNHLQTRHGFFLSGDTWNRRLGPQVAREIERYLADHYEFTVPESGQ